METKTQASTAPLERVVRRHTSGPWKIVENRYPHKLGGEHVERRIFTEWDDPQLKSGYPIVNMSVGIGAEGEGGRVFVSMSEADARLIAAAPDLLDVLEQIVRDMEAQEVLSKWHAVAAAAIAKATG